ncbi:MAG TPA: F0F1 ATP synthase subunit B [Acidimicrobiales bacterium]
MLALIAAATDSTQKAPNPIVPSGNEIFWGSVAFVVLVVLMWKFAYPAVTKAMEDRTNRIRKDLDDAERVRGEAQTILEEYQRQLSDARGEANRIIEEARQTADQLRRDLMARAEQEVNELKSRSAQDIESARERAVSDLRNQVAGLAIELAEVVVKRNLDHDTNIHLVEEYISQVGSGS